jgi:hypothetical protein
MIRIDGQKSASQAMPDGSSLTVQPTAVDGDAGIKFVSSASRGQRLSHYHAHGFNRKVILEGAAINGDFATAGGEPNAGNRSLAAASAQVLRSLCLGNFDVSHLESRWLKVDS